MNINTDCVSFAIHKTVLDKVKNEFLLSKEPGDFKKSFPYQEIQKFTALRPTVYSWSYVDDQGNHQEMSKLSGFSIPDSFPLPGALESLLDFGLEKISILQSKTKRNKKGEMKQILQVKNLNRSLWPHRHFIQNSLTSFPLGFNKKFFLDEENIANVEPSDISDDLTKYLEEIHEEIHEEFHFDDPFLDEFLPEKMPRFDSD